MTTLTSRERITAAAAAIASVEGLDALTISRLATETALSKSNVVERFGNLDNLRLATIEHAVGVFASEVTVPAGTRAPGRNRLQAMSEGWLDYAQRRVFPGGCFLTRVAAEYAGRSGPIANVVQRESLAWFDLLATEATHAGLEDPELVAYEIVALATPAVLGADSTMLGFARRAIKQRIANRG